MTAHIIPLSTPAHLNDAWNKLAAMERVCATEPALADDGEFLALLRSKQALFEQLGRIQRRARL